jgi:outer membrane biosynthesis protein TonB
MIMHAEADDIRPPSQLGRRDLDKRMAVGGVFFTLLAHLLLPGAFASVLALIAAAGLSGTPRVIKDDHVVEAHFVKLGKKADPKKIPPRKVPPKPTAPQPGVAVSKRENPPKPKKPEPPQQQEHVEEDLLTRLGDRAQTFAEIEKQREQEGDPEGVEDGTAETARMGDLYRGQLVSFFKRGWSIPSTLGDTSTLATRARVEITEELHVGGHRIVKSSGDALFDQSVEDRINELHNLGTTLPEPPAAVRSQFLGQEIDINFNGRKGP